MKTLIRLFTFIALLNGLSAQAAGKFYTQQEFDSLMAEGRTVVVHIHADWCGTCKAQDVHVSAAMNSPEFKDVTFFEVDYDIQRKTVKFFNAKMQSTLIVFRQGKEVDRTVAAREAAELQTFLKKALP